MYKTFIIYFLEAIPVSGIEWCPWPFFDYLNRIFFIYLCPWPHIHWEKLWSWDLPFNTSNPLNYVSFMYVFSICSVCDIIVRLSDIVLIFVCQSGIFICRLLKETAWMLMLTSLWDLLPTTARLAQWNAWWKRAMPLLFWAL